MDKRNLFFLLYILALIFSVVASGWVKVENDITTYLPADTETRQGLTVMNDNFTTFGTARVMVSNVTPEQAAALQDTIEGVDGVYSVDFDQTREHYKDASALYSVTFDGAATDEVSIQAVQGIRDAYGQFAHGCAPFFVRKAIISQRLRQSHSQEPTIIHPIFSQKQPEPTKSYCMGITPLK